MAISLSCDCGKQLQVKDELAGRRVKCPACGEVLNVPESEERAERAAIRPARPTPRRREAEVEEDEKRYEGKSRPQRRPARRRDADDDDEELRPRRRQPSRNAALPWIIIGSAVGGALVLVVVAIGLWKFLAPRQAAPVAGAPPAAGTPVAGAPAAGAPPAGAPAAGGPAPPPPVPGAGVLQAAAKVTLETSGEPDDRVLLAGPRPRQAGILSHAFAGGRQTHFFDRYDVTTGRRLGRTELGEIKTPQQVALSPEGDYLAVAETGAGKAGFASLVTVWSLADGRATRSKWMPYPKGDIFAVLAGMTYLDGGRLLTITQGGEVSLWGPSGDSVYSVNHGDPNHRNLMEDAYLHQPQNFAVSADRATLAVFRSGGFDLVETATGKDRGKTDVLVPQFGTVLGTALDPDGSRLAVYQRTINPATMKPEESLQVWDAKAGRVTGSFPVRVDMANNPVPPGWGGNALSWWGSAHLLLWGGNGQALVVEAATGRPIAELIGPMYAANGHIDGEGRLWYELAQPSARGSLCAASFPAGEAGQNPALAQGGYYPRWWLTEKGVGTEPGPYEVRQNILPWVGPGK